MVEKFKFNQMTNGKAQLAQKNHGRAQIKSNHM
jgi:hypothetical protein